MIAVLQSYCESLSVCVPSHCQSPSDHSKCPTGHLQCNSETCIQNQCLALVLNRERERLQGLSREKRQERPREEFREEELEDDEDSGSFISCPRGTAFCLETSRCAPTCSGDDLGQLSDDEGEIFEIEEEGDEGDDDDDDDDGQYLSCRPGTVFCMSEMRCQPFCGKEEDEEEGEMKEWFEEEEEIVCPAGQVFCMQVMACVSNCGFFDHQEKEQEVQESGEGEQIDIEVTCPEGKVSWTELEREMTIRLYRCSV